MATHVLVGGAWLGAWAWRGVARSLRAKGHDVYPVSLTGLGERVHLGGPGVDLETHIADVVNLIDSDGLDDVTLVGHSYAGIVITGVADRVPDRLGQIVYLDSVPFADGQSFLDISPPEAQAALRHQVASLGDGWRLPFPTFEALGQEASLAGLDEPARRLMREKATPHPFGTYEQPLRLGGMATAPARYGRVIVACDDIRALLAAGIPGFEVFREPAWQVVDLATGHWPMLSAPDDLAAVLDRLPTRDIDRG